MEDKEVFQQVIDEQRIFMLNHIDAKDTLLLPGLVSRKVLSQTQCQAIHDRATTNKQIVEELLVKLTMNTEENFLKFLSCLQQADNKHVARKLEEELEKKGVKLKIEGWDPPPSILFVRNQENILYPGSAQIIENMIQNIHTIDAQIAVECVDEKELPGKDLSGFTHVVRMLPKPGSNNLCAIPGSKVSHVITTPVEDYYKDDPTRKSAAMVRVNYLAVGKSQQNFFLGSELFNGWSKHMTSGDNHVMYVPMTMAYDSDLNAGFKDTAIQQIVVDLPDVYEDALRVMCLVIDALKEDSTELSNSALHFIIDQSCQLKGDLIICLKNQTRSTCIDEKCDILTLDTVADVSGFIDNAIWLFLHPAKYPNWLRLFPVSRGIPHIITKDTELYAMYEEVPARLRDAQTLISGTSEDLRDMIESKLKNKMETYALASDLTASFSRCRAVVNSQATFLLTILNGYIGKIVAKWTNHDDEKDELQVNNKLTEELRRTLSRNRKQTPKGNESWVQERVPWLARIVDPYLRLFGVLIEVTKGSIVIYTYLKDRKMVDAIVQESGLRSIHHALHLIYCQLFERSPGAHTLTLCFYPPPIAKTICKEPVKNEATFGNVYAKLGQKLIKAVEEADLQGVQHLVREADVSFIGMDGNTALTKALCPSGRQTPITQQIVYVLLNEGSNTTHCNQDGDTALHLLMKNRLSMKHMETLFRLMYDKTTDLNHQNEAGETVLILAMKHPLLFLPAMRKIVRYLLGGHIDVNIKDKSGNSAMLNLFGNTSLIPGTITEIFQELISSGAQASCTNKLGQTGLHITFNNRNLDLSEGQKIRNMLLTKGTNINQRDVRGNSLLSLVLYHLETTDHGNKILVDVILPLLDAGANPQIQDQDGNTGAMRICMDHWHSYENLQGFEELLKKLLPGKESVDLQNKNGETLMMLAAGKENVRVLQHALASDGDPNLTDWYDRTAILHIYDSRKLGKQMIMMLLEAGASINHADECGETLLHMISQRIYHGQEEILEFMDFLLAVGADVNQQNKNGKTAGLVFMQQKYFPRQKKEQSDFRLRVIDSMIVAGLQADVRDMRGESMLSHAWIDNDLHLASVLTDMGALADCRVNKYSLQNELLMILSDSTTLLHLACSQLSVKGVSWLLHHGARMTTLDKGISPLGLNLLCDKKGEIFLQFVWHGHPVNMQIAGDMNVLDCLQTNNAAEKYFPLIAAAGYKIQLSESSMESEDLPMSTNSQAQTVDLRSTKNVSDEKESVKSVRKMSITLHDGSQRLMYMDADYNLRSFWSNDKVKRASDEDKLIPAHHSIQSLKHQSRIALRKHLVEVTDGRSILQIVQKLGLPIGLDHYLLLEDELKLVGFEKMKKDVMPSEEELHKFYRGYNPYMF